MEQITKYQSEVRNVWRKNILIFCTDNINVFSYIDFMVSLIMSTEAIVPQNCFCLSINKEHLWNLQSCQTAPSTVVLFSNWDVSYTSDVISLNNHMHFYSIFNIIQATLLRSLCFSSNGTNAALNLKTISQDHYQTKSGTEPSWNIWAWPNVDKEAMF